MNRYGETVSRMNYRRQTSIFTDLGVLLGLFGLLFMGLLSLFF